MVQTLSQQQPNQAPRSMPDHRKLLTKCNFGNAHGYVRCKLLQTGKSELHQLVEIFSTNSTHIAQHFVCLAKNWRKPLCHPWVLAGSVWQTHWQLGTFATLPCHAQESLYLHIHAQTHEESTCVVTFQGMTHTWTCPLQVLAKRWLRKLAWCPWRPAHPEGNVPTPSPRTSQCNTNSNLNSKIRKINHTDKGTWEQFWPQRQLNHYSCSQRTSWTVHQCTDHWHKPFFFSCTRIETSPLCLRHTYTSHPLHQTCLWHLYL